MSNDANVSTATDMLKSKKTRIDSRRVEGWLNAALEESFIKEASQKNQKNALLTSAGMSNSSAKHTKIKGTALYGIDTAALERLGMNSKIIERVYRAMFVYSHGLHDLLEEATRQCSSRSHAMMILWRVFVLLLERCGELEGSEAVSTLVGRGNRAVLRELQDEYERQIEVLIAERNALGDRFSSLELELSRLREEKARIQNERELYGHDYRVALQKYELEIRKRMDAEVRLLEVDKWLTAVMEELNSSRDQNSLLLKMLAEIQAKSLTDASDSEHLLSKCENLETEMQVIRTQRVGWVQEKEQAERLINALRLQNDKLAADLGHSRMEKQDLDAKYKQLNDQHTETSAQLRRTKVNLEDTAARLNDSEVRCLRLQRDSESERQKVAELNKELNEIKDFAMDLGKKKDHLDTEVLGLQLSQKKMAEQVAEMEISEQEAIRVKNVAVSDAIVLKERLGAQEAQLQVTDNISKKLNADLSFTTNNLERVASERNNLEAEVSVLKSNFKDASETVNRLKIAITRLETSLDASQREKVISEKLFINQKDILEQRLTDEKKNALEMQNLFKQSEIDRHNLQMLCRKIQNELSSARGQIRMLENNASMQDTVSVARTMVAEEQRDEIERYKTLIADQIENIDLSKDILLEEERKEASLQMQRIEESFKLAVAKLESHREMWQMRYEELYSFFTLSDAASHYRDAAKELAAVRLELEKTKRSLAVALADANNNHLELQQAMDTINTLEDKVALIASQRDGLEESLMTLRSEQDHLRTQIDSADALKRGIQRELDDCRREANQILSILKGHVKPSFIAELSLVLGCQSVTANSVLDILRTNVKEAKSHAMNVSASVKQQNQYVSSRMVSSTSSRPSSPDLAKESKVIISHGQFSMEDEEVGWKLLLEAEEQLNLAKRTITAVAGGEGGTISVQLATEMLGLPESVINEGKFQTEWASYLMSLVRFDSKELEDSVCNDFAPTLSTAAAVSSPSRSTKKSIKNNKESTTNSKKKRISEIPTALTVVDAIFKFTDSSRNVNSIESEIMDGNSSENEILVSSSDGDISKEKEDSENSDNEYETDSQIYNDQNDNLPPSKKSRSAFQILLDDLFAKSSDLKTISKSTQYIQGTGFGYEGGVTEAFSQTDLSYQFLDAILATETGVDGYRAPRLETLRRAGSKVEIIDRNQDDEDRNEIEDDVAGGSSFILKPLNESDNAIDFNLKFERSNLSDIKNSNFFSNPLKPRENPSRPSSATALLSPLLDILPHSPPAPLIGDHASKNMASNSSSQSLTSRGAKLVYHQNQMKSNSSISSNTPQLSPPPTARDPWSFDLNQESTQVNVDSSFEVGPLSSEAVGAGRASRNSNHQHAGHARHSTNGLSAAPKFETVVIAKGEHWSQASVTTIKMTSSPNDDRHKSKGNEISHRCSNSMLPLLMAQADANAEGTHLLERMKQELKDDRGISSILGKNRSSQQKTLPNQIPKNNNTSPVRNSMTSNSIELLNQGLTATLPPLLGVSKPTSSLGVENGNANAIQQPNVRVDKLRHTNTSVSFSVNEDDKMLSVQDDPLLGLKHEDFSLFEVPGDQSLHGFESNNVGGLLRGSGGANIISRVLTLNKNNQSSHSIDKTPNLDSSLSWAKRLSISSAINVNKPKKR